MSCAGSGRRLVVLRHGRTAWNVEGRFQGRDHPGDPPLDDVGLQQADLAAAALLDWKPAMIVTSDSRRARQTAARLAQATGLVAVTDARLRERGLGRWEGLRRDEVAARYPSEYQSWAAGVDPDRLHGESRQELGERACAVVAQLPAGVAAVLVTHRATAGSLVQRLLGLPVSARRVGGLDNGRWSELAQGRDGWLLRSHNTGG